MEFKLNIHYQYFIRPTNTDKTRWTKSENLIRFLRCTIVEFYCQRVLELNSSKLYWGKLEKAEVRHAIPTIFQLAHQNEISARSAGNAPCNHHLNIHKLTQKMRMRKWYSWVDFHKFNAYTPQNVSLVDFSLKRFGHGSYRPSGSLELVYRENFHRSASYECYFRSEY